jgi:drug/metabolite transporter (DMT)-like permease
MVSALRETSVLFAALIGKFFLNERLTVTRILSSITIVAGVVMLVA